MGIQPETVKREYSYEKYNVDVKHGRFRGHTIWLFEKEQSLS